MCLIVVGYGMVLVYYVGVDGWKKFLGDDVGEFYYKYFLVLLIIVVE